jgi:hypothetical protein
MKTKMDPVADILGSGRIVSYKADFAHLTGSVTAGLLLSQFWYFSGLPTAAARDGWFYVTMDEISEQTGMIREEQETARKRLKALGVLEEKRIGVPAKLWYRLDKDRLYELLSEFAAFKAEKMQDAGIPQSGNPPPKNAGIPQSVVRELRNLARGKVTDKDVGMIQSTTIDFSETSLKNSLETRKRESVPPINPPMGEGKGTVTQPTWNNETPNPALGGQSGITGINPKSGGNSESGPDAVWSSVMEILKGQVESGEINAPTWNGHLKLLRLISISETTTAEGVTDSLGVVIGTPSVFTRDWVEKRQGQRITAVLSSVLGRSVTTAFEATVK